VLAAACGPRAAPTAPAGRVPVADGVWYALDDAEERNRENPDTFQIPPRAARDNLDTGQIVKLLFAITAGGEEQVERMWVIFERRDGAEYVGRLDNRPMSTGAIQAGMLVRFEPRHVIAIHPKRAGEGRAAEHVGPPDRGGGK